MKPGKKGQLSIEYLLLIAATLAFTAFLIPAVNENFQSGKDHLASEILNDAVGRLTGLMSALVSVQTRHSELDWQSLSIDEKKLSEVITRLNETLSNIASAMEKNDIVYAGDILEYELPELLEAFIPFLSLVLERVSV